LGSKSACKAHCEVAMRRIFILNADHEHLDLDGEALKMGE
jgi:hypothetical protein